MKLRHYITALLFLLAVGTVVHVLRKAAPAFAALDLGGGYTMRFFVASPAFLDDMPIEYSQLDYELSQGTRVLWRRSFGGTFRPPDTIKFQVLNSSDRSVAALTESSAPEVVIYIIDLATGDDWSERHSYASKPVQERGSLLLARLQPGISQQLILSSQVKGRPPGL